MHEKVHDDLLDIFEGSKKNKKVSFLQEDQINF
jgi:hypothetical protein